MTIRITKPELEALINQRLKNGGFKDAEDVIMQAIQSSAPKPQVPQRPDTTSPTKSIEELFAPLRGLNLEFSRNPSTGRPVDL